MADVNIAPLSDRTVLQVTGDDAHSFLQGLVTNDVDKLTPGDAQYAALLTPQGKILFDFFVLRTNDGYLIDVDQEKAGELAKRLGFYKLRAKVAIDNKSQQTAVVAIWGSDTAQAAAPVCFADPRHDALGLRAFAPRDALDYAIDDLIAASDGARATEADYHAHRIALGIPEGGKDFAFGGSFPHETCMDILHGIDFDKGCYVGQEVVSRMQHRGTARKRIVPLSASEPLPESGAEIRAGKALIGSLGSTDGNNGLALIRLDRASEAIGKGETITAGDVAVTLLQPDWAPFKVPTGAA